MTTFIKTIQRIWRRLLAKETTDNQDNVVIATSPAPLSEAAVKMLDLRAQINILLQDLNPCGIVDFPTNAYYDYTRSIIGYYQLHGSSRQSLTTIWLGSRGVHPADEHDLFSNFMLCVNKLDTILKAHFEEHPEKMYASPRLPYPTNIHFCSDFRLVEQHYQSLFDQLVLSSPMCFVNHGSRLLLTTLVAYTSETNDMWWKADSHVEDSDRLLEDWLLAPGVLWPRVVKVGLRLSIDIHHLCGMGYGFSAEFDAYLISTFMDELRDFIADDKISLFLREFIFFQSYCAILEIPRLQSYHVLLEPVMRDFYFKHPIFYPNYVRRRLFDNLRPVDHVLDPASDGSYPAELIMTLTTTGIHHKPDQAFFERLKAEAQLLRPGMKVLDYLFWIFDLNYDDNYPQYDELVLWLRKQGFEFEGDDPLGLKDLADQWKDVNHRSAFFNYDKDGYFTKPR